MGVGRIERGEEEIDRRGSGLGIVTGVSGRKSELERTVIEIKLGPWGSSCETATLVNVGNLQA